MVIFHSYVSLPDGIYLYSPREVYETHHRSFNFYTAAVSPAECGVKRRSTAPQSERNPEKKKTVY